MKLRTLMCAIVTVVMVLCVNVYADALYVANYSFESPYVEPNQIALPYAEGWIDWDNHDNMETGVFYNSTDITNTDGNQLAYLSGEEGTVFIQDLGATYQAGKSYRLTVGVCVSWYTPPDPNRLEIAFYYRDPNIVDVASDLTPPPSLLSPLAMEDRSVYLATVQSDAPCVGKPIGIAFRAHGPVGYPGAYGTYWDLDNVRVTEYVFPNFTDDTIVNFADFAMMAADWQSCDNPITDVTGDGCVKEDDVLILMEHWLGND